MDTITRVCRKCGQEKPLEEFAKNKECVLGRTHTCKQCKAEKSRKWREANLEKARESVRKWRASNRERGLVYARKYYASNPEKVRERHRKWRAANPEKVRERARKSWRRMADNINDSYLKSQLKKCDLPITPETIEYKRIQLKLYREIKNQQTP